jgi:hypothetical protein
VISISTDPTAFARERIHLGDTTNFFRAAGFFVSAISTAFLAEVTTLYLLGIGKLAEPYYWLFILLTSIPFVVVCSLLVRLVAPLSFKDVLHLSLYPIGAGVFVGAVFALVASAVVRSLVDVGYIPDINHDFSQWGLGEGLSRDAFDSLVSDSLKESSLLYTILAGRLGDGYSNVKYPFGHISNIRPLITLLYLIIAAMIFMAAVDRRKPVVFGMVLLAALISTGAIVQSLDYYLAWNYENSGCRADEITERGKDRVAESLVKQKAQELQTELDKTNGVWSVLDLSPCFFSPAVNGRESRANEPGPSFVET